MQKLHWAIVKEIATGRLNLRVSRNLFFVGAFCRILDFLTSLFDLLSLFLPPYRFAFRRAPRVSFFWQPNSPTIRALVTNATHDTLPSFIICISLTGG